LSNQDYPFPFLARLLHESVYAVSSLMAYYLAFFRCCVPAAAPPWAQQRSGQWGDADQSREFR